MGEVGQQDRRRRERIPADIGLTCRVPAQPVQGKLLDLSLYGCRVELARSHAETGSTIIFEMPNGDRMNGQVMWSIEREAGVRFAHALKPATAIVLGLVEEQPVVISANPSLTTDAGDRGRLHHWYRGLSRIFG